MRLCIRQGNGVCIGTNIPVSPKKSWFNEALRDPLAFYGSLLCVSGHLELLRHTDMSESNCMHIETMRLINERLADPEMSISNTTIATVASVALYEVRLLFYCCLSRSNHALIFLLTYDLRPQ